MWLPGEGWPIGIKIVAPGRHIKEDLVELVEVVDNVCSKVGLEEGAAGVIPITVGRQHTQKYIKYNLISCHGHSKHSSECTQQ